MKRLWRKPSLILAVPFLSLSLLLAACGGGPVVAQGPVVAFPNARNFPMLDIKDRVVNLRGTTGFRYAKLSMAVV
ncbi:MAG: hypothetical protein ACYDAG_15105, partial [Chloroflexota bacterium]